MNEMTTPTEKAKLHALKSSMTYDEWLKRYKGKSVHDINVNEHTKWAPEFRAWKAGNIE